MKSKIIFSLLTAIILPNLSAEILNIKKNQAAKVGDNIIMKAEVEREMRISGVSYEEALQNKIDFEVLYLTAKIYIAPPEEKEILEAIKNDKSYYALHFKKELESVSDLEFLNAVGFKNKSMKEYREYLIKRLMVEKYLEILYSEAELLNNTITQQEIDDFILKNPTTFKVDENYELMIIYFSYFDAQGVQISDGEMKKKYKRAQECLKELKEGANFSEAARKYSEDLYSLNQSPVGYYGIIEKNDEYTKKRFTQEILEALSTAKLGIIFKVFGATDGLFLFNLLQRESERNIVGEEASIIAENYVRRDNINQAKKKIRQKTIESFRNKFNVTLF